MEKFLEEILQKIVDKPKAITISTDEDDEAIVLEVRLAQDDLGRVIGRRGRTINSLKNILYLFNKKTRKETMDYNDRPKRIVLNVVGEET